MRKLSIGERLQPALLDRLCDDQPTQQRESREDRGITQQKLRAAVLRDLAWLLNAVRPTDGLDWDGAPLAQDSVINFGLPAFSGRGMSTLDVSDLEAQIRKAIVTFEPRIDPSTVRVRALESSDALAAHNQMQFEIQGDLWSQPVPIEVLLRTDVDLETGQVQIREVA